MNINDLRLSLAAGDFQVLAGLLEDDVLEAKSGKYDTATDAGKAELAKDVSSFANRSGGLIVVGARTGDDSTISSRRIESVSPFPVELIDPADYFNILRDWIFPQVENLEINWHASQTDRSNGLLSIFIPPQPEILKPFLLKKDVDPVSNVRRKEIMFGFVERNSHNSKPTTIDQIHRMMRLGRDHSMLERILDRLNAIEVNLPPSQEQSERKKGLEAILSSRVTIASKAVALLHVPNYHLGITPVEVTEVRSLFSSSPGGVKEKLEHPRQLRYAGWDMYTSDKAELVGGKLLRVSSEGYKVIDLYRDGTQVFVCTAGHELLCWGESFGDGRFNPLALIETTYMFFDLFAGILQDLEPQPRTLRVRVGLSHMKSEELTYVLAPHDVGSISPLSPFNSHRAPNDSWSVPFEVEVSDYSASRVSFIAIRELYAFFGIALEGIPYLNNTQNGIDENRLKNPR